MFFILTLLIHVLQSYTLNKLFSLMDFVIFSTEIGSKNILI